MRLDEPGRQYIRPCTHRSCWSQPCQTQLPHRWRQTRTRRSSTRSQTRRLVHWSFVLDNKPPEHHFNYSGFLASIYGQWFMITAGHILQELDPAIETGRLVFTGRVLADFYGEGAKHFQPIPFDYASHKRVHAYDKDLIDFALIALSYLDVEQLKANGRMPFTFEGRPERAWEDYDGFAILGFPDEDVTSDVKGKWVLSR